MKKKVFRFTDNNYSGVIFEKPLGILEWIKADLETATVLGDKYEYEIEIVEMTQEEIDNLPEIQ